MSWRWSSFELDAAARLCEAIYPAGVHPRLSLGVADTDIRGFLPRLVAVLPHTSATLMRAGLWVAWLCPVFHGLGLRTFGRLSADERDRLVAALADHRIYWVRELMMIWKAYGGMGFASDPRVRGQIGIADTGPARHVTEGAADAPVPAPEPIALGRGGPP